MSSIICTAHPLRVARGGGAGVNPSFVKTFQKQEKWPQETVNVLFKSLLYWHFSLSVHSSSLIPSYPWSRKERTPTWCQWCPRDPTFPREPRYSKTLRFTSSLWTVVCLNIGWKKKNVPNGSLCRKLPGLSLIRNQVLSMKNVACYCTLCLRVLHQSHNMRTKKDDECQLD